jgi:hypothetical protein
MKESAVTEKIWEQVQILREAMLDGKYQAVEKQRRWLVGQSAKALLNQDADLLRFLSGRFVNLGHLADQCELPSQPRDSWEMLRDVLFACAETSRPLEQIRLTDKKICQAGFYAAF